ncbi:MAG: UDP-4-amino-4,6-dideoxy-N-acetyl-beta-L-altrosamine N-acetyltransferase [Arcobacteraceae bacterium]|nr:UDP-4-amino-4,6-dideoxy-N-acetyl-beta-L-altrosamine N-acetyltransferase [Arcobacteraceae bacterium]
MSTISLINFIDLTLKEKKLILSWRNNPNIRKWMFTTETISLEQHLKFIETLKNSKDKQYFVVKDDNNYLGVIDFCNVTKTSLEMGLYKNPEVSNVGKILLNSVLQHAFNSLKVETIISEVFEVNKKAYELYISIGFKPYSSKIFNNKKVTCMELKNGNR